MTEVTDGGELEDYEEVDRPRGVLSTSDRRFLTLSDTERTDEFSRPGRRQRENAIEERINHAVIDLALLTRTIDQEEVKINLEDVFTANESAWEDIPRVQTSMRPAIQFLIRGIIIGQPDRSIIDALDFTRTLDPVITRFEDSIEAWLNAQRGMTADFELSLDVENVRSVDSLIEELEIRRSPVTGEDRLRISGVLDRAGLGEDRILELLGEEPDEEEGSAFSLEELAAMSNDQLAVLLDAERITVDEQIAALEEKYGEE
jgi:hypothetical protein